MSRFRVEPLEDRRVPAGGWFAVLNGGTATLVNPAGATVATAPALGVGPTVAVGDVTGDRVPDLIVGSGAGVAPGVTAYDGSSGSAVRSFIPFEVAFTGGVRVAAGDVTKDGVADFVVAAGAGGGPRVRVLDGTTLGEVTAFFAFDPSFAGGVTVAAADVDGDERADVVVGAGPGGGPQVRVLAGNGAEIRSFFAYEPDFRGGTTVAAADLDADGFADVVTGPGAGGGPRVRTFDGKTGAAEGNFFARTADGRTGAGVATIFGENGANLCVAADAAGGGLDFDGRTFAAIAGPGAANGTAVLAGAPVKGDDAVQAWQSVLIQALRTEATPPTVASRKLAIVAAAVYDAVNSIEGGFAPYLAAVPDAAGADVSAAATAAAHGTLTALFPNQAATFDAVRAGQLSRIAAGAAKDRGVAVGAAAATAILAARAGDGSAATATFVPGTAPGEWVPTPPAFKAALTPRWGQVTPFTTDDIAVFAAPSPPALTSPEYAAAVNEVKEIGSKASPTRTAEQTEIARFWAGTPGPAPSPPGMWAAIALRQSRERNLSAAAAARLFARLHLALADAAIASWAVKYEDNFWRPVTAIRAADTDGNPATAADPAWEPLLTTPNFPANTSGHSTFSAAAAEVLAAAFGDAAAFSASSDELPGVVRSYPDFRTAAAEAGRSRIFGGIHYAFDNAGGLASGRAVGAAAVATLLAPVP